MPPGTHLTSKRLRFWKPREQVPLPENPPPPLATEQVAALYLQHSEELRCFLVGLLRDSQLASDVLQATFVKMVQRGGETQEESRKAWLFRVAYHEAMAIRRRDAVGEKIVKRIAEDGGQGGGFVRGMPEDSLIRHESVERVREALEQLPPDQRQVVRMRIYEEKTFAVIAEELKIPLGTALGRMRSALIKLRARLGESADSIGQSREHKGE
jgi:RNA polymerase sigma-70 factor (ECF subfamily)